MKIKVLLRSAVALGFALCVASASAHRHIHVGNHPQSDENNILFGASQTGTTVNGEVGHSGLGVSFSSLTGQTLFQKAQGQASITTTSGAPLTSMSVSVAAGYTFGDFI